MCNEAYRLLAFYNSNESSVSTHICKLPSRYNLAYSSGSSTASEVNAQSDPGVVFKSFSYIDYRNRRADFIKSYWELIDWDKVADRIFPLYTAPPKGSLLEGAGNSP